MKSMTTSFLSLITVTALVGGCGFDFFPTTSEPQPVAVSGPEAYRIGVLDGPLADELEEGMQLIAHTGTASDKPIVIAAAALDEMTADQVTAINAAYAAKQPIILVYAGLEDIVALQRLLGNDSYEYELPDGAPYVEIYAIDQEADGSMWEWTLAPPASIASEQSETTTYDFSARSQETTQTPEQTVSLGYDNDANQDSRATLLIQWVAENGQRMEAPAVQAARLQVAESAPMEELTRITGAFGKIWVFPADGNSYQIKSLVWKCHSMVDNHDYYYVQQLGTFSASAAYKADSDKHRGWYLRSIETDAWIDGFEMQPAVVTCLMQSPQTDRTATTVTSGVTWSLGGEVGLDQTNGVSGKASFGVQVSDSTTVTVTDCVVLNKSNDRGNNAHWLYDFKQPDVSGWGNVEKPPVLAINTFSPVNQWIWEMSPQVRTKYPKGLSVSMSCVVKTEDTSSTAFKSTRTTRTLASMRVFTIPYPPAK